MESYYSRCWKFWTCSYIGTLFWQKLNHGAATCELSCGVWHSIIQEEESVCHNQEVQCEQATLHSDSTLHCKGERSLEASCLCQLNFERIRKARPSLARLYVFFWELQCFIVLLSDSVIDMKIFIFFNHSLKFLWAQQYELESWFFWKILKFEKIRFFHIVLQKTSQNLFAKQVRFSKITKIGRFWYRFTNFS